MPGGQSYLRFGFEGNLANGGDDPVSLGGEIGRLDLQYMRFLSTDTMLGFGAFVETTQLDIEGAGTVQRDGAGLRADLLHRFSDHWGFVGRTEYSWGESDLEVAAGPAMTLQHVQGDDRFYMQAELVGTYSSEDTASIPQGWVLHPILGANYQLNSIEETADSFGAVSSGVVGDTEEYGTVWGKLRLEKKARPGQWAPNVTIGLEHEYANDLDLVVEESTYAILGAGLSLMQKDGSRADLSYVRHQGIDGDRWNQSFVAAFTMTF